MNGVQPKRGIITQQHIKRAKAEGRERLAKFVNARTYGSYDIFLACERQRRINLEDNLDWFMRTGK